MPHKQDESSPFIPRYSCTAEGIGEDGLRLDRYAAENLKLLSRSQIRARNLRARVNSREVKISRILKSGDSLELFWEDAEPENLIPEDLPLDILYEDDRVAVINKAQGMVVHPGAGNFHGTLANALYFRRLNRQNHEGDLGLRPNEPGLRPGIVHRLDKDTSGIIITAWDEEAHVFLADQFKNRRVTKTYAAVVQGCPDSQGRIDSPIGRNKHNRKIFSIDPGGKASLTFYKVVKSWDAYSLLLLRPKTGRTHQIRVHLKSIGHPILGDPLYSRPDPVFPRQTLMLHAKRLSIILPGEKQRRSFRTPFPRRFLDLFSILDSGNN